jgi:hypothetical protein
MAAAGLGEIFSRDDVHSYTDDEGKNGEILGDKRNEIVHQRGNWFTAALARDLAPGRGSAVEFFVDISSSNATSAFGDGSCGNTCLGVVRVSNVTKGLKKMQGGGLVWCCDTGGGVFYGDDEVPRTKEDKPTNPSPSKIKRLFRLPGRVRVRLSYEYSGGGGESDEEDDGFGKFSIFPANDDGPRAGATLEDGEDARFDITRIPKNCVPFVGVYHSRAIVELSTSLVKSAAKR